MLAGMMGTSIVVSCLMHFMTGIIFAACYVYFFNPKVHISSKFLKGVLFGSVVFVFAQIMTLLIEMMKPMPAMGEKTLLMIGSLIGHLIYGLIVALIVPNYAVAREGKNIKTAHSY